MFSAQLIYIPALVAVGLLYSGVFPVNKMSADADLPYVGYVFWLSLIGFAATGIPAVIRRELPKLSWPSLRAYLVLGALGVAIPAPLLVYVAAKVPVGIVTLLMILVPLLTYALARTDKLPYQERFRAKQKHFHSSEDSVLGSPKPRRSSFFHFSNSARAHIPRAIPP